MTFAVAGVKRMQQMLEGMLQYAQVDGMLSPPAAVSLNTVLRMVKSNMHESLATTSAVFRIPDNLPVVTGHTTQLIQVFQNMLSN
ncbi:MAG: PAS domain-containing sensor histidine kinase, partial [Bacteroidetes bacterium]|nr:PAS domain-containing sensor histidine kinase [Bacteroidota bacterium]